MERLRKVTFARAAGLGALLAVGCASTSKVPEAVTQVVKSATEWTTPSPATELVCVWQRRLSLLPDPTRDGAQIPGIAGQMFLMDKDGKAATVVGDVTVAVYDESPRPAGTPAHTPEVWHFTADVVKAKLTNDERFGKSYVMFLPWLPEWRDVTAVRVLTRYDAPGMPTLHSGDVRINLDLTAPDAPVWSEAGKPGAPSGLAESRSVPDGAKVVRRAQAALQSGAVPVVQPAVGFAPQAPKPAPPLVQPIIVQRSGSE